MKNSVHISQTRKLSFHPLLQNGDLPAQGGQGFACEMVGIPNQISINTIRRLQPKMKLSSTSPDQWRSLPLRHQHLVQWGSHQHLTNPLKVTSTRSSGGVYPVNIAKSSDFTLILRSRELSDRGQFESIITLTMFLSVCQSVGWLVGLSFSLIFVLSLDGVCQRGINFFNSGRDRRVEGGVE